MKVVINNFDKNIDEILPISSLNIIERREAADSIRRKMTKFLLKVFIFIFLVQKVKIKFNLNKTEVSRTYK